MHEAVCGAAIKLLTTHSLKTAEQNLLSADTFNQSVFHLPKIFLQAVLRRLDVGLDFRHFGLHFRVQLLDCIKDGLIPNDGWEVIAALNVFRYIIEALRSIT